MSSTNNNCPARRTQVPRIRIDSPSVSDPMRLQVDPASYSMFPSPFMPSTLLSQEGYPPNTQFSPLDELGSEAFSLEELGMSLFDDPIQQHEMYDLEFLTGPMETPSISGFQYIPPQTVPQNTCVNSPYTPVFAPSPSSSYGSLSPSPLSHDSPQFPWSPASPSSNGSMSPMVSPSELSRRGSSASLRHHHSPSDPMVLGHTLQPPTAGRHIRSHSESCMARPIASQAMIDANQKRRRHDATHKCDVCGQTFTATFSLKRHTQSHSGVRPFTCGIPGCGQTFFNQSDCRRHEKSTKRHKSLHHTLPESR